MSNPFSNVCTSVEAYSFNKTYTRKIDTMSESAAANSTLRKMKALEADAIMEANIIKEENEYYKNRRNEGIVNRYIKESQIPININRISNEAKDFVLKDILFEVFYNSLLMDKDFLEENCQHIKCLTDKYVDDNGGFKFLDKLVKDNMDNMLLKKIKSVCEAVAKEVCDRKLKDSKECKNMDLIDFDMTADEKDMLDYSKKDNLNIDKISELVKDKVLTVVKDEKTRSEKVAKEQEDIENELMNSGNTEEELNEAMNNIILNKPVIESGTLFNTLFRDCYQEYIAENVSIVATDMSNIEKDKEVSKNYDTEMDIDDALNDEHPVEDTEVNMDLILTEALTKYTLMEMLYTMGFENYSYENIKKLTENMLNSSPVNNNIDTVVETEEFAKNRSEFFGIFNKLKDDPSNETYRTKMSNFMSNKCKDKAVKNECKGFIAISKKQIDGIIEKNPKMKDKYTDLSNFMDSVFGDK